MKPSYDMCPCDLEEVRALCVRYHGYASAGCNATYAFGVYEDGRIVAGYDSNGAHGGRGLIRAGHTTIQRWEHWACPRGEAAKHLEAAGWVRVPIPGKVWRSGNQAYTYERIDKGQVA